MRTYHFLAFVTLLLPLVPATPIVAEGGKLPQKASALVFEFEVLQEKALSEIPLDRLVEQYVAHLEGIQEQMQSDGNLDGALAAAKEVEVASSGEITKGAETDPKQLTKARATYLNTRKEMEERAQAGIVTLRKKLVAALENLQKEFTINGKIDEAIAIKNYIDQLPVDEAPPSVTLTRQSVAQKGDIDIKLQIDGKSFLCLRGDELWYDHRGGSWKPPGRHNGAHPTHINQKVEWMPVWKDKETERYDAGLGIPVGVDHLDLNIRISDGRAQVEVVQTPSKNNDYTIKLELLDANEDGKGFGGASWVRFRLSWKS